MAGFREFVTGEVLTASNVDDYLAKQAVMKFADAAARNTALGTAVGGSNALREGMVAYLDDTDEVVKYDGAAWGTIGAAGIGSNVVSTVLAGTFTSTSTSYTDITGMSVTITPTSNTAKILVVVNMSIAFTAGSGRAGYKLIRGATDIYLGDVAGVRPQASRVAGVGAYQNMSGDMVFLDSPATTAATTYKLASIISGGTITVNAAGDNSNATTIYRGASSITVIEVAP